MIGSILIFFSTYVAMASEYSADSPLTISHLEALKGRIFRVGEHSLTSRHVSSNDRKCPGMFSSYARGPDQIKIVQEGCSGTVGGMPFEIKDQQITFPGSDLTMSVSIDFKMLRIDSEESERAILPPDGHAGFRPWDSEIDAGYSVVRRGAKCNADIEYVGTFDSEHPCADAVLLEGATQFLYGKGSQLGECYKVFTSSRECPEGFADSEEFDYFSHVDELPEELVGEGLREIAKAMRLQGHEDIAMRYESKLQSFTNRRRRLSAAEIRLAESSDEIGGRSSACGHSHKKTECMKKFSDASNVIINVFGRDQDEVCKKSSDKLQRTHPGCCGGEKAWYCLGLCCKGGGGLSCCGANWGWTLDPVFDNYCYADQGSFKYIAGHDVCPENKHSCTVWKGGKGEVCADNAKACMKEIFKKFIKMIEVVVNIVEMVLTFGESAVVKEMVNLTKETLRQGAIQAAKAATKKDARRIMMSLWKQAGITMKDFKHVLKTELKEIPEELGTELLEEVAAIMMAGAADYDKMSPEDIAWAVGEVVDPTGIVSLTNFLLNGQEDCVYPETMAESEQKDLVFLTGHVPILEDYSIFYSLIDCGDKAPTQAECEGLETTIIAGHVIGDFEGVSHAENDYCGCMARNYVPTSDKFTNVYYGDNGRWCEQQPRGDSPAARTSICKVQRKCTGKNYEQYVEHGCHNRGDNYVSPCTDKGYMDCCIDACDFNEACTGFYVEDIDPSETGKPGRPNCYLQLNTICELMPMSGDHTVYKKEFCSHDKYLDEDGGHCPASGMLTEMECQALDGLRLAGDLVADYQYAHEWPSDGGNPCGCFLAGTDNDYKMYYNTRKTDCDAPYREDGIPVCRKGKDTCYDVLPDTIQYGGPYTQKGYYEDRPFFCREDGNFTIHYNMDDELWHVCSSEGTHPCRWNATNGYDHCSGDQILGTLVDYGRFPKDGAISGNIGGTLKQKKCKTQTKSTYDTYFSTLPGDLCPTAIHVIRDQAECATAIRFLQWNTQGEWNIVRNPPYPYDNSMDLFPAGCSTEGGDATPNFETSSWGRGKGRFGVRQICKRPKYYMQDYTVTNHQYNAIQADTRHKLCPNGASYINDKNECKEAVSLLGLESYMDLNGHGNNGEYVHGCSYALGQTSLHFGTSTTIPNLPTMEKILYTSGRASICREVNCQSYMGDSPPGFGTPFKVIDLLETSEQNVLGFNSQCEKRCLMIDECAGYRALETGTCELFWYSECSSVEPPQSVEEEGTSVDQTKSFGLCPHSGSSGMQPIQAESECACPVDFLSSEGLGCEIDGNPPDMMTCRTFACGRKFMKWKERGVKKNTDLDYAFVMFIPPYDYQAEMVEHFDLFIKNPALLEALIYDEVNDWAWGTNCMLSYTKDRECSACTKEGPFCETTELHGEFAFERFEKKKYTFYQMTPGFFSGHPEIMTAGQCFWAERIGYYIEEGHGEETDCYDSLEEAERVCISSTDCHAVTTQNNMCGGKYRVSHGGPTFTFYAEYQSIDLRSYEKICALPGLEWQLISTNQYLYCADYTDSSFVGSHEQCQDWCKTTEGCEYASYWLVPSQFCALSESCTIMTPIDEKTQTVNIYWNPSLVSSMNSNLGGSSPSGSLGGSSGEGSDIDVKSTESSSTNLDVQSGTVHIEILDSSSVTIDIQLAEEEEETAISSKKSGDKPKLEASMSSQDSAKIKQLGSEASSAISQMSGSLSALAFIGLLSALFGIYHLIWNKRFKNDYTPI